MNIWPFLIGADVGLQERANAEMRERGEEPSFWQRHPMYPYVIGFVLGPFLFIPVMAGVIYYAEWLAFFDQRHGNTGLFDIFGMIVLPIWAFRRLFRTRRHRPGNEITRR